MAHMCGKPVVIVSRHEAGILFKAGKRSSRNADCSAKSIFVTRVAFNYRLPRRRLMIMTADAASKNSLRDCVAGGTRSRPSASRSSAVASEWLPRSSEANQSQRFDLKFIHMQALWAVSHLGTFEKAGTLLGLQWRTVSKYLKVLERNLGVKLFKEKIKPSGHAMDLLSDAGNVMLYYSEQILLLAHDACQALSEMNDPSPGSLSIGVSQGSQALLLPLLAKDFLHGDSVSSVDLTVTDSSSICAAVMSGRLDCGLVDDVLRSARGVLDVSRIVREDILLVVPLGHKFAKRASVATDELYGIEFCVCISGSTTSRTPEYSSTLRSSGIRLQDLKVRSYVNSLDSLKELTALGVGAAFLPASAVRRELEEGRLVAVPLDGARLVHSMYLVTDPRRYSSRTQQMFLDRLFQVAPVCHIDALRESGGAVRMLPLESYDCIGPLSASQGAGKNAEAGSVLSSSWHCEDSDDDILGNMSRGSLLRLMNSQRSLPSMSSPPPPIGAAKQQLAGHLPFKLADLQLFHAVVKLGSFTAAAAYYRFAVSTVHYSIHRLERNLGLQIVDTTRGKNRVVLTEAGEILQHYVARMMVMLEETQKAMNDVRDVRTGNVHLGASQTTGTYLVPRLIGIFRSRNPFVSVNLQVSSSQRICTSVAEGKIDVALVGSRIPESLEDRLVATPYATDELVLIVSQQHPLAASRTIEKDDLYSLNFVSVKEGSTVQLMQCRILKHHGIKWQDLRVDLEFDSIEAIKSAVRYNLGAAFVSVSAIEKELQLGLIAQVPIRDMRLLRTLYLVSNPAGYLSPAAEKFMNEVLELQPGASHNHASAVSAQLRLSHKQTRPWEGRQSP